MNKKILLHEIRFYVRCLFLFFVYSCSSLIFLHAIKIPYSRNAKRDHKERFVMNDFGVIKFYFLLFFVTPRTGTRLLTLFSTTKTAVESVESGLPHTPAGTGST